MKKKILLTFFASLLFVTSLSAQTEHLKFMGIPIDGKASVFGKKIEQKGLKYYAKVSNGYIYKGDFAGYSSEIFTLFDNKKKIVYGVGVQITCYSESVAKDTYWRFVRDLKDKYNAIKLSDYINLYKENPEDLYPDTKNGKFKEFNIISTDSINNFTQIEISKVELRDSDSLVVSSPLGFGISYLYLKYSGNIGSIKVKYEKSDSPYSYRDEYNVLITYRDEQNTTENIERRKDDL